MPQDRSTSPSPSTRPRAPTITVDTSAVCSTDSSRAIGSNNVALRPLGDTISQSRGEPSSNTDLSPSAIVQSSSASHKSAASKGSITDIRSSQSFDHNRDSRPTSPHNVSSPVTKFGDRSHGLLTVPGARSRQNSVESDGISQISASYGGETNVQTVSGGSASGDLDRRDYENGLHNIDVTKDQDALKPDPGMEAEFEMLDNRFAFTTGLLNKLMNPKSLSAFYQLGGLSGLEKGLRTDRHGGLSSNETVLNGTVSFDSVAPRSAASGPETLQDTSTTSIGRRTTLGRTATSSTKKKATDIPFSDRKQVFSDNRLPEKKGKSLLQLMWITYNDKVLILLSIAAVVSLAVGLYQTFGTTHSDTNPPIEWVEGVAIIAAITIVVIVGSLNDYQKERQFVKLNKKKQDRSVSVVRSGKTQEISVYDILVGDVVLMAAGDMVPVDGIFIEGFNIKCDESHATGESDLIRKKPAEEVFTAIEKGANIRKMDPFILSGSQITEGVGSFLVTSTGVNSSYGKILMSLREDPEVTPLQSKLNTLAEYIAKLGGAAGLLLFIVLFIEFLARLKNNTATATEKGQQFLNIFIVTVTIIVVAVPEGLPLAVTLALAFATTRMLKDKNLVRHLKACEVMGNATNICTDKTGTLTQNQMSVVRGSVGTSSRFGGISKAAPENQSQDGHAPAPRAGENIPPHEVIKTFSEETKTLLVQSIAINSTAFEGEIDGRQSFIGSKTETALLSFAREFLAMRPVAEERSNAKIAQLIPFDSKRKCMGVAVELSNGKFRLYVKGASEILLEQCTEVIRDPAKDITSMPISTENRDYFTNLITSYAERSLRTIGLVYRDFESWPPKQARRAEGDPNEAAFDEVFKQMVMLSIVGIQDPLRPGVRQAVETCQKAGVMVRMVTGDNIATAKAIATECGIFTPRGIAMEGPAFRKLSSREKDGIIPNLQVLARSSPEDKRILVKRLKEMGETVAVTGDGTNDAPALRSADVGFAMGIAGTEVAKEASAIILMDDNFASIVKAMMWGRAVNDAVKKFLQFQVTVNITAVLLTFITAVSSSSEQSVLTAVQLLWVNLIMDTLAALALATDPPTPSILDRKPDPKSAPLISVTMWKMIIGESVYQLVITLMVYYAAAQIWDYEPYESNNIQTFVFNAFVWMQIFNQWNNRRLDNRFNIFEGMLRNWFFLAVNAVMIGGQILIIFFGGHAFDIKGLTGEQWGYSIFFGFLSIPIGAIIRLIPDELVRSLIPDSFTRSQQKGPQVTIEDEEAQYHYPRPLSDVKEELTFLKRVKGGRLNNLVFAMQHPRETLIRSRSGSRSRSNSLPHTPTDTLSEDPFAAGLTPESRRRGRSNRSRSNSALGATTVMAGIIAGSVAGWSPIERGYGDTDPMRFPRLAPPDLNAKDGVEVHPATKLDDSVGVENPRGLEVPPSQADFVGPASAFGDMTHKPSDSGSKP